jgi:hypothetical protein
MLLWKTILCLLSANLASSGLTKPDTLVDDGAGSLQPLKDSLQNTKSSKDLHLIRGLLIAREAPPEILANYIPRAELQPLRNSQQNSDAAEDLHLIRGLLRSRQNNCPSGYGQCSNAPSKLVSLSLFLIPLFRSFSHPPLHTLISYSTLK